jgi:fructuronate reductase
MALLEPLTPAALQSISQRGVTVPEYARGGTPGVVHLGLGAFHRAHQAWVFDALLRTGDTRWGVLGVAMQNTQLADALAAQSGLYAVQIASTGGTEWQVGGAIWQTCVAAREPDCVVRALAAAGTRWVTITVTEKGYQSTLADLLVRGLAARHAAGLGGLTIASCDNLTGNGHKLQALCINAAPPALATWINSACAFPNSMVDRIVPAATPGRLAAAADALGVADACALGTEAFWEWVIERRFVDAGDGAALAAHGVTVVDDVAPYEEAKLRMLNGSHTAMACMGAVAGLPVIGECITQPAVATFISGLMTHEIGPYVRRTDWPAYRDALLQRFGNPALQHSVHQIATDSSQKIPQRWPPSVEAALSAGTSFERLAFAAAAWMRYVRGYDEQGRAYVQNDPMAAQLLALAQAHAGDASATVQSLGTLTAVWGVTLPHHTAWLARVTHWLAHIDQHGMMAALAYFNSQQAA